MKEGSDISVSVGDYFSTMLDQSMNWQDAAVVRKKWGTQFCLKGVMSIADAKRAVDRRDRQVKEHDPERSGISSASLRPETEVAFF